MQYPVALAISLAVAHGCTFGNLGGYDIQLCDPNVSPDKDTCRQLPPPDACSAYKCDRVERRCITGVRDDDRDGDPPASCGGTDCDDADPKRSGVAKEACDGVDNDCDNLVDDHGVLTPKTAVTVQTVSGVDSDVAFDGGDTGDWHATFVQKDAAGGRCLRSLPLPAGDLSSTCTFLGAETSLSPRHPTVRTFGGVQGAAFVTTSACTSGTLAYRSALVGTFGKAALACGATAGASLPTIGATTLSGPALIAFYDAPTSERGDPVRGCAAAKASALKLAVVNGQATSAPSMDVPITVSSNVISIRPPSFADVGGSKLLASPTSTGASIAVLDTSAGVKIASTVDLPTFTGARSVMLSVAVDGATTRVALVGEIGCTPTQTVRLALGTFNGTGGLAMGDAVEISGAAGSVATQPSAAWIDARKEWLVTWVADGPRVLGRRFTSAGLAIDDVIVFSTTASVAAPTAGSEVYVFDGASFAHVPLLCGG